MKKITTLMVLVLFLTSATVIPSIENTVSSNEPNKLDFSRLTAEQIIHLKASQLKQMTGNEINFKDRIVLNLLQKNLKREVKKNRIEKNTPINFQKYFEEGKSSFKIGGFILGLLFGLIGVALVHIFSSDKGAKKSSWQGFGVWLILLLVLALI